MKHDTHIRQVFALLLAAVLLCGSVFPGRAMAAEETEPTVTETEETLPSGVWEEQTVPTETEAVETGPAMPAETTIPTEETTTPAEETTVPTEETVPTEPVQVTIPEETQGTEPSETAETVPEETEPSAMEQLAADMEALAEEARHLEADVGVLDEFAYRLRKTWNRGYDLNEEGLMTDEELTIIDDMGWAILDFLKTEYRYEDGVIAALDLARYGSQETPMAATAENSVASLGSSSGIKFRIFNYTNGKDENGNYITAGGINDNGLDGYFNFRGTSYENTGADGQTVSNFTNSQTDIDGYTANHATVLPNLSSGGYPVFNASRGGGTNQSLGYLFGAGGKGVTAYTAGNTPLRLNEKGQYYYNSADNAVDFDTAANQFIVRKYQERGQTTANQGTGQYYDFFPFTYWNGNGEFTSDSGRSYNYEVMEVDYWFGMTMEAAFSMPAGGRVSNQDEMVFEFSGDDDVWVFIDDVLVLDLGGTHGVVSGSINFATGEVRQYLDWNGTTSASQTTSYPTNLQTRFEAAGKEPNGGWSDTQGAKGKIFADYTEHTIKFYYLERATSCANCKISFNMPILPTGKLTVQKQIDGILTEETGKADYRFVLWEKAGGTEKPAGGVRFDVIDGDTEQVIGTNTTASNGEFTLKAGQKAEFNLTAGKTFLVRETDTGAYTEAVKCTVNDTEQAAPTSSGEIYIDPDVPVEVVFTNRLKTTAFSVSKQVAGNMGDRDQLFTFTAWLYTDPSAETAIGFPTPEEGEAYALQGGAATFQLKHGETGITLDDIPIGAYVVIAETGAEGYGTTHRIGETAENGTIARIHSLTAPQQVTFTNTREVLIDTGIVLDWMPYMQILTGAGAGILLLGKRKKQKE